MYFRIWPYYPCTNDSSACLSYLVRLLVYLRRRVRLQERAVACRHAEQGTRHGAALHGYGREQGCGGLPPVQDVHCCRWTGRGGCAAGKKLPRRHCFARVRLSQACFGLLMAEAPELASVTTEDGVSPREQPGRGKRVLTWSNTCI
jgi:hypothetical protein